MILPHNANPRRDGIFGKDRVNIEVEARAFVRFLLRAITPRQPQPLYF
jgi:hypothetical protein